MSQFVSNIQKKSSKIDASQNSFKSKEALFFLKNRCGFKNPKLLKEPELISYVAESKYKVNFDLSKSEMVESEIVKAYQSLQRTMNVEGVRYNHSTNQVSFIFVIDEDMNS